MNIQLRGGSLASAAVLAAAVLAGSSVFADAPAASNDLQLQIQDLKTKVAQLEQQENDGWINQQRAEQIKAIVQDVMADAKSHGQFMDGDVQAGYNNGFFIQTADQSSKLVIGGFMQVRYSYANFDVHNSKAFSKAPLGSFQEPADADGFELRRARINLSGNILSKDVFFAIEGDFAGAASNSADFQVTDAYIGYRFADWAKIKAGSFKVPFAKAELTKDTQIDFDERAYELTPFDPVRSIGVSLFGDIVKDKITYDINVNNGGLSGGNTLGRPIDNTGKSDNRLAFYTRVQWAPMGKVSDFDDEPDFRDPKGDRDFIMMFGAAAGYDSANATTTAFPAAQGNDTIVGLSSAGSPGFHAPVALNGDLYRGTIDWSAKWQGLSLNLAGYAQEINQNPGTLTAAIPAAGGSAAVSGTSAIGDLGANIFQVGYYGQVGYFIIPQRLEIVSRVGQLLTESQSNRSESYAIGLNYYLFHNNAKVMTDVTYIPNEAAYSSNVQDTAINTQDIIARIQLQVKF